LLCYQLGADHFAGNLLRLFWAMQTLWVDERSEENRYNIPVDFVNSSLEPIVELAFSTTTGKNLRFNYEFMTACVARS